MKRQTTRARLTTTTAATPVNANIAGLVDERGASAITGLSPRSLQRGRREGWGPKFCRIGQRRIAYQRQAIAEWLASRTYASRAAELAAQPTE